MIQQISDVLLTDAAAADTSVSTCDQIEQEDVQLNELEQQCLELMAEGYAPIRLARMLDVSANELQKLETGIMDKLSANNRFQAVAKGFMLGVITNHAQQPARS